MHCFRLRWPSMTVVIAMLCGDLSDWLASASNSVSKEVEIRPQGSTHQYRPRDHTESAKFWRQLPSSHHPSFAQQRHFSHGMRLPPPKPRKPYYERKVLKSGEECAEVERRTLQKSRRIPNVLILTGRNESFSTLDKEVRDNIERILMADPAMTMRWFGDKACASYVEEHYDKELLELFNSERHGSRRGDLCRTAVLLREGGFYLDLDVVLAVPLRDLVDDDTTFMSAYEDPTNDDGGLLNAIIAAEPGSTVLDRTIDEFRKWYRGEVDHVDADGVYHWMGPTTLMRGLLSTMDTDCPCEALEKRRKAIFQHNHEMQWTCGSHNVRLYVQRELLCKHHRDPFECSAKRARSNFQGSKFGLFEPGVRRKLVAWCRPDSCTHAGCDLGGWDETSSFAQNALHLRDSNETKRFLRREQ